MPKGLMQRMLRSHLLWEYHNDSGFISWSSSLLWVLEHAARMHTYEQKEDVHLAVMDTRSVHDMALFPAVKLMEVFGIPEATDPRASKLQHRYYGSEYLSYGPMLNVPNDRYYRAIPWAQICEADSPGLLELFSDRSTSEIRLLARIGKHRHHFETYTNLARPQEVFPTAILIGGLFGPELQVVVATALITLLCGDQRIPPEKAIKYLRSLRLTRPFAWLSIMKYNWPQYIPEELSEVIRMYRYLTELLSLIHEGESREVSLERAASQLSVQ